MEETAHNLIYFALGVFVRVAALCIGLLRDLLLQCFFLVLEMLLVEHLSQFVDLDDHFLAYFLCRGRVLSRRV